jgi:hypothetical protein
MKGSSFTSAIASLLVVSLAAGLRAASAGDFQPGRPGAGERGDAPTASLYAAQVGRRPDASSFDQTHAVLNDLLTRHISNGLVDYQGLARDRASLQQYLATLAALGQTSYSHFTREQQLALLINAHNAFTLDLILEQAPVASIQDIPAYRTEPRWTLAGQAVSLDDLENRWIRPVFTEPRVHFALVRSARGGPPLRPEAYRADRLEDQLEDAARIFARSHRWNRLERGAKTLYISRIFEWYGADFLSRWGKSPLPEGSSRDRVEIAILGFFIDHLEAADSEYLGRTPVTIRYLGYDWRLDDQGSQ